MWPNAKLSRRRRRQRSDKAGEQRTSSHRRRQMARRLSALVKSYAFVSLRLGQSNRSTPRPAMTKNAMRAHGGQCDSTTTVVTIVEPEEWEWDSSTRLHAPDKASANGLTTETPRATAPIHLRVEVFIRATTRNAPAQAGRASDVRLSTEPRSRPCMQPDGWASSFHLSHPSSPTQVKRTPNQESNKSTDQPANSQPVGAASGARKHE
jgi:hypothetical protein